MVWRIVALSLVLTVLLAAPVGAQQPDPHRAGLVVVHGDGRVISACVTFSEESISGAELLRRSGLDVALTGYGGLGYGVCAIGGEGCPARQDCFCQCRGNPCAYWVYSHRRSDGSWSISGTGASGWQVHDGDVDGWVWGDGSTTPPVVTFDEICPSIEANPAALPLTSTTASTAPSSDAPPIRTVAEDVQAAGPAGQAGTGQHNLDLLGSYGLFGLMVLGLVSLLVVVRCRGGRA